MSSFKLLALCGALALSTGAGAVTASLGANPNVVTGSLTSGLFSDDWQFSLTGSSTFTAYAASFGVKSGTLFVYSYGADGLFDTSDDVSLLGPVGVTGTSFGTPNVLSLTAGKYYVEVGGKQGAGPNHGYSLAVTTVSQVPEPHPYALLLGGLGVFGLLAKRRKI
jgi:hypothetical protein